MNSFEYILYTLEEGSGTYNELTYADGIAFNTFFNLPTQEHQVHSQIILLSERGVYVHPIKLRYAWPSELDLMARLAGLNLKQRWGSWDKSEYNEERLNIFR